MSHDTPPQAKPTCMDLEAEANSEEQGTFLGLRGKARVVLLATCFGTLAFATLWLLTYPSSVPGVK